MTTNFIRAYCDRAAMADAAPGTPIRFVASTENIARDGMIIEAAGWDLSAYKANPVFLWCHFYDQPPIGRADASVEAKQLIADVVFDQGDEFARNIERKYRTGFMNAVSVGWNTIEMKPGTTPIITQAELLDVSAVPVPADPSALAERHARGLADLNRSLSLILSNDDPRSAIPPHSTDKAPEDAPWDGPAEMAACPAEEAPLRRMTAWVDDEGDPNAKQSYKLPHHLHAGEVIWKGVAAAMARLLQSDTQIPDSDRKGVFVHLERHYKQFDKEAPEFRTNEELAALTPDLIRGLFLEGEDRLSPELFVEETRIGAVLSARNRTDLEQARQLIADVIERASKEEPKTEQHAQPLSQAARDQLVAVRLSQAFKL